MFTEVANKKLGKLFMGHIIFYLLSAEWTVASVFKPLPNAVKVVKVFTWLDKTYEYFLNIF